MKMTACTIFLLLITPAGLVGAESENVARLDRAGCSLSLSNVVYSLSDFPRPEDVANWKSAILSAMSVLPKEGFRANTTAELLVPANGKATPLELVQIVHRLKASCLADLSTIEMLGEQGKKIDGHALNDILGREGQNLLRLKTIPAGDYALLNGNYLGAEVYDLALTLKKNLVERLLIEISLGRGNVQSLGTIDLYLPDICKQFGHDGDGYHDMKSSQVVVMAYPANLCRIFNLSRMFLVALEANKDGHAFRDILTAKEPDNDLITWVLSYLVAQQDRSLLPLLKDMKAQVTSPLIPYFAETIWRLENPTEIFDYSKIHSDVPVLPSLNSK